MKINLTEIYAQLEAWRAERKITAQSQRQGYIINIMEEFGELSAALRDYERFSKPSYPYPKNKKYAEHGIIDALCDIAVFTINAGADIRDEYKPLSIDTTNTFSDFNCLLLYTSTFDFKKILLNCAVLCEKYGFNFEIAMLETIKEISSRTGSYDEATKKWIKDSSDEARAKWYSANYELARIKLMAFIDNAIKEKISTRLVTEIKNAIDAQKYHLRRNMRKNLKKKTDERNVSENSAPYKVLYELAEKEIEFLIADIEWYRTLLEKEKAKKWYQKLWESIKNE